MNTNTTTTGRKKISKGWKITGGVAAFVLVAGIIGSAGDDEPTDIAEAPATTSQTTPEPVADEPETVADETTTMPEPDDTPTYEELAEHVFLNQVADYQYPSEDDALKVGYLACGLLSNGSTPESLAMETITATDPVVPGFRNDELPRIYGAAIGSLCQEHLHMLDAYQ